jgi:hypothetical protein
LLSFQSPVYTNLLHPAPVAAVAAVSTTQVAAGEAGPFSLTTPTIRAGLTAATAGTDGILPPTNSQEVATAADADAAVNAAAATCPSRPPLASRVVYSGHLFLSSPILASSFF